MAPLVHRIVPASEPRRGTAVFLHGWGDSLEGWSFLPEVVDLPWLEWILVQAPLPQGEGWAWYELDSDLETTPRGRGHIAEHSLLLEEFLRSLDRPLERTVVGGFSQGSAMSLEFGLRSDLPCAGVLCLSGYVPLLEDYPAALGTSAKTRRFLCTHGQWDDVIPVGTARSQYATLAARGVPIGMEVFDKDHGFDVFDERRRMREWLLERLG